jgi:hypothetical protein
MQSATEEKRTTLTSVNKNSDAIVNKTKITKLIKEVYSATDF